MEKEEKPKSKVIPRSRLCGFLSKAAVDATVLSALATKMNTHHYTRQQVNAKKKAAILESKWP
jgi:hypothetical protein